MKLGRRKFLGTGSAALIGLSLKSERKIEGSFVNEAAAAGHLLRDRKSFPAAKQTVKIPIVIVGAGISGLSAAWRLKKRGFEDFVLLEMNEQAGGNARSGENEITAYPWAAHYVPVPGKQATYVRELFTDLGVLKNGEWEERYLVFAPQERLFLYGRWQDGIEPAVGLNQKDRRFIRKRSSRGGPSAARSQLFPCSETNRKNSNRDCWRRHFRIKRGLAPQKKRV